MHDGRLSFHALRYVQVALVLCFGCTSIQASDDGVSKFQTFDFEVEDVFEKKRVS